MEPWMVEAHALEERFGIPQGLYVALIRQESGGRQNARSPVGAIGRAQLMPKTAEGLGVDPYNATQNLLGGAMYLSQGLKRYGGDIPKTLASYNAGPGAVAKYNGVPPYPETQDYVKKVTGFWSQARGNRGMPTATTPQAPQNGSQAPQQPRASTLALSNQYNRVANAYAEAPEYGAQHLDALQDRIQGSLSTPQAPGAILGKPSAPGKAYTGAGFQTPNGLIRGMLPGEDPYQFYQRLGTKGFGLQNDAGTNQTTGGSHRSGSLHYANQAVDFGNGKNPVALLDQFYGYANDNRERLGINELLMEDPGTSNHHVHIGGTGASPIKPANRRSRPPRAIRAANAR